MADQCPYHNSELKQELYELAEPILADFRNYLKSLTDEHISNALDKVVKDMTSSDYYRIVHNNKRNFEETLPELATKLYEKLFYAFWSDYNNTVDTKTIRAILDKYRDNNVSYVNLEQFLTAPVFLAMSILVYSTSSVLIENVDERKALELSIVASKIHRDRFIALQNQIKSYIKNNDDKSYQKRIPEIQEELPGIGCVGVTAGLTKHCIRILGICANYIEAEQYDE